MKSPKDPKFNDSDLLVYGKAKAKSIDVKKISEVKVVQYCNIEHKKEHEKIRINAPDELKDGETYKDATIASIRSISIKDKE